MKRRRTIHCLTIEESRQWLQQQHQQPQQQQQQQRLFAAEHGSKASNESENCRTKKLRKKPIKKDEKPAE